MTLLGKVADNLNYPGRTHRRSWEGDGRIHVEVKGIDGPDAPQVARRVERALRQRAGVAWAQVDLLEQRALICYQPAEISPSEVIEAIEEAEAGAGVAESRFPVDAPEHPADHEGVTRHLLALSADIAGLGLVGFGRLLRSTPLPVEAAAIVTLIDNEPRLRRFLESHIGTPTTDLGLAVTNAVGQGLTQGPLGVIVDGIHRGNLLAEALGRRQAWERAESRQFGSQTSASRVAGRLDPPPARARPVPLPDGPVETYCDRSSLAGLGGAIATYAATSSPRRAAASLIAGIPKAARLGRESFAAHLDRALSARDLVVLDATALRRLDRVDTVMIDGDLARTGRSSIGGLRLIDTDDAFEAHRRLAVMFDPTSAASTRTRGRWSLGPPTADERRRIAIRRARRELAASEIVVLRAGGQPIAVAAVHRELSSAILQIVRAARQQGHMVVIAGDDKELVEDYRADLLVGRGVAMLEAVESLQSDGCVVALIAAGGADHVGALRGADVSLELPTFDGTSWAGDIVLNETAEAAFVLDAIGSARQISRQSVALSAAGLGLGALGALTGLPGRAAARASTGVNAAALVSIANGMRAAVYLNRHGGRVAPDPVQWHQMDIKSVLRRLDSSEDGLSASEAAHRRRAVTGGQAPAPSLLGSIAAEVANPLTPVLLGGAAASAAVGSPADAGIVAGVSAVNTLIGGLQRFGAERAIRSLSEASATTVTVERPGGRQHQASEELVPGDVVVLGSGDAVPADCRVLKISNLEVDESSLTGESETVTKQPEPTFSAVLAERSSMLYEGTTIAAGEVTAVVVAVGGDTTANALDAAGGDARLARLTSLTLPIAAGGGAAMMGLGFWRGQDINRSVGSAVALSVAAVPEGLPLLATMAQLASARRLSTHQALVRNPRAIEALGRVRVLCTDKTGTLTEGRIRLRRVSDGVDDVALADLDTHHLRIVAAGRRASPAGEPDTLAHLTDRAVVHGAIGCGATPVTGAAGWARSHELPFEPARGYHAVLATTADGPLLSVKGAPEVVIPRCTGWRQDGGIQAIDGAVRRRLDREVDRLARQGLRVLAVAEGATTSTAALADEHVADLTLLGFLVLSDPVRATAAHAVRGLRAAGVEVVMVTGDHPSTAEGIAVELGILNGHRLVTGAQLDAMSDAELDATIADVAVFARVTPADKVRIVSALQRQGQAVAMTGDGANDAPAIRLADVGIALGARATPAARRAADLIVTDERIETIVDAIIEGRAMWTSVREALAILLGGNLGEVAFTVAATAVTGVSPLSARQLLAVNLLTDVAPALAIAVRPPPNQSPEALMAEGPDASLGESLQQAIALRAASTALGAGTAWTLARLTGRHQRASTTALVALVGSQLGQTVTSGGLDPWVLVAGGGSAVLLAAIVQTPGVSQFFGCTPLGPVAWSIALGSATLATAASAIGSRLATAANASSVTAIA